MNFSLIFLFIFTMGSLSLAHSRLKASDSIKIRSMNPGVKTGPCGGLARVAQPAVLKAGDTVTVTWEETIYHPGRYEFYFSQSGDSNFTLLKTVPNGVNNTPVPHQFSTTLALPNVACDDCTLQMIQVMTENPNNPSNYYSCADMQLKAIGTTPPTPAPSHTDPNCP